GDAAGFTICLARKDRGAPAARCAHRRAGTGAGSEGRADPEAAERAGQVPLRDPARHPTGASAKLRHLAGRAEDQEAGHFRRAHGF
ncbi:hypothetical protein E2320_008378, partial [Naja naja]